MDELLPPTRSKWQRALALLALLESSLAWCEERLGALESWGCSPLGSGDTELWPSLVNHWTASLLFQKNRLLLRPYMPLCWDLVTRWERLCPTTHRTHVPYAVFAAMMSLAISWLWTSWAAITGLAFYGPARIGECLAVVRRNILLPSDLLAGSDGSCYVRLSEPKSRHRGMGRSQHLSIKVPGFVTFLERVLAGAHPSLQVFVASAASYSCCRRWRFPKK